MENTDLVTIHVANSQAEAQILAGLLISEGLNARIAGQELSDEFGMAKKLSSVEVGVPRGQSEKALDIVAAWKDRATEETTE